MSMKNFKFIGVLLLCSLLSLPSIAACLPYGYKGKFSKKSNGCIITAEINLNGYHSKGKYIGELGGQCEYNKCFGRVTIECGGCTTIYKIIGYTTWDNQFSELNIIPSKMPYLTTVKASLSGNTLRIYGGDEWLDNVSLTKVGVSSSSSRKKSVGSKKRR